MIKPEKKGGRGISGVLDLRHVDDDLLVGVTRQLRLLLQPLSPRLLHDGLARARRRLVHCVDGVKVYVLVQAVLDGGCDVIGMIMLVVMVAVASSSSSMAGVLVVAV